MLLDDREIHSERGAAALSLWMVGLLVWVVVSLSRQAANGYFFSSDYEAFVYLHEVFLGLQALGLVAAVLIALGVWRYVQASTEHPIYRLAAAVFALDVLIDVTYLGLSLTSDGVDFEQREAVYDVLGHVWRVLTFLRVGGLLLLFAHMARLSESLGSPIASARVWGAMGAAGLWGLVIAASALDLLPGGAVGMGISALMTLLVSGATVAVLLPHRAALRGAATSPAAADPPVPGLAAAGRGLGMYHGAIVGQLGWLIVGNGLTLLVVETGDLEGAKSMMGLVPVVAFVIQCFAVAGLVRFARRLPPLHAAGGSAGIAVTGQVLNLVLGLVTVGLVLRALESGRLRYLFDLQDQLPVLQGISALVGSFAAVALLGALEHIGTERELGGLKVAIPILGGLALLFHLLDPRDIGGGALLAFAVVLLVGAIVVATRFLGAVRRTAEAMRMEP